MVFRFFQKKSAFNFANKANFLIFAALCLLLAGRVPSLSAEPEKSRGENDASSISKKHLPECTEKAEMSLNQLPPDALIDLLTFLEPKDKNTFKAISRAFHDLFWARITSCTFNDIPTDQSPLALKRIAEVTQNSPYLTKISFLNRSNLSTDNRTSLARLQHRSALIKLNLGNCKAMTDEGLAYFTHLSNLRTLDLAYCTQIKGKGLLSLSKLEHLEDLDLNFCNIAEWFTGEMSLSFIAQLTHLKSLRMVGDKISDRSAIFLSKLSNLTRLELKTFKKTTTLSFLRALSKLTWLELKTEFTMSEEIAKEGFSCLSHCSNLENLFLYLCPVTDDHLFLMGELLHLKRLTLSNCDEISETGFAPLFKVSCLELLILKNCLRMRDASLADITQLSNLTTLDLSQSLNRLTDDSIIPLSKLSNLTTLNLSESQEITDAGVISLSHLSNLRALDLSQCYEMTDAGVMPLSNLSCLTSLNLAVCSGVTDLSVDALVTLSNLKFLKLGSVSSLTEAGRQRLRDALPKTEISCKLRDKKYRTPEF